MGINVKQLFAGVLIGCITTTTLGVVAANSDIPLLTPNIKFLFNSQPKELPSDYTVLSYKDRTYVPARFVAEELGAKVDWNEQNQTISISKAADPNSSANQIEYTALPAIQVNQFARLEVYAFTTREDRSIFYVKLKNLAEPNLQLLQNDAWLETEGSKYYASKVDTSIPYVKDQSWYNDIREDEKREGFITLPKVSEKERQGILHLKVLVNDRTQKEVECDIPVKW